MSSARFIVADVFDGLASLPDQSVHSVITSPPYWRKRHYTDDEREIGKEPSPGEFLATLLHVTDELWRVVRDDGTIWFNLGDTAAESGGWGSDVDRIGRGGGRRWKGTHGLEGAPLAKSVCWIPELFGASLAYGRNLLTGEPCQQWITRPPVVWCKPAPTPGQIIDKFREATELFVWAAKQGRYYFDLDAVREPPKEDWGDRVVNSSAFRGHPNEKPLQGRPDRAVNPKGVPPKNWWEINTARGNGTEDDHPAKFPPELIRRPVLASCPPGGTILDPFAGTGTTALVANGNGRDAVLIDFDPRNAERAREQLGMFLTVEEPAEPGVPA